MVKPQSPELARNRLGQTDQDGKEIEADAVMPAEDDPRAPVPEANRAGVRDDDEQDKPTVPPHER
jgi:hypothetical protein